MSDPVAEQVRRQAAEEYFARVSELLQRIRRTQAGALEKAACLVADTVERGGIMYAFGSGHSASAAIELYFRAGGLTCCDVIYDKTFGRAERLSGYAEVLLESYPIGPNDLLIVISNSGRNALPVEMALEGRKRGVATVGITSLAHSLSVQPRNAAGLRLCEVCDVVIDNCGLPGDAIVTAGDGDPVRVGPTSTLAGVFILNSIVCAAVDELHCRNIRPPVLISANLDEGDTHNEPYLNQLKGRIRGL